MPSEKKKEIYLAKTLAELNKMATLPESAKRNSPKILMSTSKNLLTQAVKYDEEGDEERAFVLYMKYHSLNGLVRKSADYKKDKEYYDDMIGMRNLRKAMDRAEKLADSLITRYEEREAEIVSKKFAKLEKEKLVDEVNYSDNEVKTEDKSKDDVVDNKKKEESDDVIVNGGTPVKEPNPYENETITPIQLYNLIEDVNTQLLIMDVRMSTQFEESHIKDKSCINVPESAVKPGTTAKYIYQGLSPESKSLWDQRANYDFIVLLDWNSILSNVLPGTILQTLRDALYKFDLSVVLKSSPLILEGGYEQWLLYYRQFTTNPLLETVAKPLVSNLPSLEFDYPDIDEELRKATEPPPQPEPVTPHLPSNHNISSMQQPSMPSFDRSLKPSGIGSESSTDLSPSPLSSSTSSSSSAFVPTNENSFIPKSAAQILNTYKVRYDTKGLSNDVPKNADAYDNRKSEVKPDSGYMSGSNSTSTFVSQNEAELEALWKKQREKEEELKILQQEKERVLLEHKARVKRLKKDAEDLEKLAAMKQKEQKDVADLMRLKRKLESDLKVESLKGEQAEEKSKEEEGMRKAELTIMKQDEADKMARLEAVEHLRAERKKKEDERIQLEKQELDRRQTEIEAKETAERRDETERLREEKRKAEEATKRLQEEKQVEDDKVLLERQQLQAKKVLEEEEEVKRKRIHLLEEQELLLKKKLQIQAEEDKKRHEDEEKSFREQQKRLEEEKQTRINEENRKHQQEQQHFEAELKRLEEEQRKAEDDRKRIEEEHRARIEEERKRVDEERMKRQLMQESLEIERREQLEKERKNKEKLEEELKADMVRKETEEKQKLQQKLQADENRPKSAAPTPSLPGGWEKRLDPRTNRYFYIDHQTGSTHWDLPNKTYKTRLRDDASQSSAGRGGLSRSHSSPNIAKLVEDEQNQAIQPAFNRMVKPVVVSQPTAVRPSVSHVKAARRRDLDPIYGSAHRSLTGLRNLGNTCYMNSTIQCLNNCSPLVKFFLDDLYLQHLNRESEMGHYGEVVDEFAVVVKALWAGQYRSIAPRDFKFICGKYNDMFAGYAQQDSQELLAFLLDSLHEGLNSIRDRPQIKEQENDEIPDNLAAERAWKIHKDLNASIIVELFQGQLKSTLRCMTCSKRSVRFDTFQYLTLPIPSTTKCSVQDCLKLFLKEEKLTGSSRWKCPRCKTERDAIKKLDIYKLPHILIIHLNRFFYEGVWRQKLNTNIDFPLSGLDLNAYVDGPRRRKDYNLYACSNHYGSLEGGHYTAFCKSPCSNNWHKFDDHEVHDMSKSGVKSSAAYFLFYSCLELKAV